MVRILRIIWQDFGEDKEDIVIDDIVLILGLDR
jgi:hypothetical protein